MKATGSKKLPPRMKALTAALLMAAALFIALGLVAGRLESIHEFSGLGIVYWVLYSGFLLMLLVAATIVGLSWS